MIRSHNFICGYDCNGTNVYLAKKIIISVVLSAMGSSEIPFYTGESAPYGKTYGHWTVRWWQWALSIPKSKSPLLDVTGEYSHVNQPSENVWFLAGKMANETMDVPNRFCTIPAARSILFPVINCEANRLEYPELKTEHDILERVERDEDTIVRKECTMNGKSIPAQRIKSDPLIFELRINEDNPINVKGGTVQASADGFWVFLKPLSTGQYSISFQGSCEFGKLNSGANYRLKIFDKDRVSA
jgi:hypothetical protein